METNWKVGHPYPRGGSRLPMGVTNRNIRWWMCGDEGRRCRSCPVASGGWSDQKPPGHCFARDAAMMLGSKFRLPPWFEIIFPFAEVKSFLKKYSD
jgi:hypothetical protein